MIKVYSIVLYALAISLSLSGTVHYSKGEMQLSNDEGREIESAADMTEEELQDYLIRSYGSFMNYRSYLIDTIKEQFKLYFPNVYWSIRNDIRKEGNNYVMEIYGFDEDAGSMEDKKCSAQFVLKPDFSMEIMEDTITIYPDNGFGITATDTVYAYHGCRIVEHYGEYYDQERDLRLQVVMPLFSIRDSMEWNEINCRIWEGLEEWFSREVSYENGIVSLDYEIKTLDRELYSVLFTGVYESDSGEKEETALGITVAMGRGVLLQEAIFNENAEEGSSYGYYIEDDRMHYISRNKGSILFVQGGEEKFYDYSIEKKEREVYSHGGEWTGECYYELPQISNEAEGAAIINKSLQEDMGRFFNGLAEEFEGFAKEDSYVDWGQNEPACHCRVNSEVFFNNNDRFGVVYHYRLWMCEIEEEGDATAVYNTENGEILEYQEWQSDLIPRVKLYKRIDKLGKHLNIKVSEKETAET